MAIKRAVMEAGPIRHPEETDLGFLYGTIFIAPPRHEGVHSRNVCIFADGQVDRSPTGTGVSGRLAIHHARGELKPGDRLVIESLVDSCFTGSVLETTTVGALPAVVPEVAGDAHITGRHEFLIDPRIRSAGVLSRVIGRSSPRQGSTDGAGAAARGPGSSGARATGDLGPSGALGHPDLGLDLIDLAGDPVDPLAQHGELVVRVTPSLWSPAATDRSTTLRVF